MAARFVEREVGGRALSPGLSAVHPKKKTVAGSDGPCRHRVAPNGVARLKTASMFENFRRRPHRNSATSLSSVVISGSSKLVYLRALLLLHFAFKLKQTRWVLLCQVTMMS